MIYDDIINKLRMHVVVGLARRIVESRPDTDNELERLLAGLGFEVI